MVRPNTAFTILGLIAAGILWTSVSYAAPFFLGDSLDGGGPGTTGRGSVWFTDFDVGACDYSLTGDVVSDAFLDPDSETAVGIQLNAFDSALQLVVNGSAFNDSDDTGDVVSDAAGQAATLGPEPMAGLQVTIEWRALASTATMRTFATLQNATGADITVPISWETNLGSDAGTTAVGSSSGDTTFDAGDRWLVTSDDALPVGDPVNTTVLFGPGNPDVRPSSVADLFNGCAGEQGVVAGYTATVPAGQSRYLLFFNQMNQTNAEALAAATGFDANPAPDSVFLFGIGPQLPAILNWDFQVAGPAGTPGPPALPLASIRPTRSAGATPRAIPGTGKGPSGDGAQLPGWVVVGGAVTLGVAGGYVLTVVHRRTQ